MVGFTVYVTLEISDRIVYRNGCLPRSKAAHCSEGKANRREETASLIPNEQMFFLVFPLTRQPGGALSSSGPVPYWWEAQHGDEE
jgi:hypothetical protein